MKFYQLLLDLILCGCSLDAGGSPKCQIKFDINICMSNATQNVSRKDCMQDVGLCSRNVTFASIQLEPYTTDILHDLIRRCCGTCSKTTTTDISLPDVSKIPDIGSNSVDFVFPVLGKTSAKKMFGYHFIPLIQPPSLYYFTAKDKYIFAKMMVHCFRLWPLILISIFFIAVSGFLIWLLETGRNPVEFPTSFLSGWMSGCWWSFISMTTVGYGDKVPKSGAGRCFSSVWVLIGIATFSLITAMLASQLTLTNSHRQPQMAGRPIGVLKHRAHDTTAVVVHGGIATASSSPGKEGIPELIRMLKEKEIDGFVLDLYILIKFHRHSKNSSASAGDIDFLHTDTIRSEMIASTGEQLSHGFLVKEKEDFEYLYDFVVDNYQVISTCNGLLLNSYSHEIQEQEIQNPLFSPHGYIFWPAFITGSIIIGGILCFGAIYDTLRRKQKGKFQPHGNSVLNAEHVRSVMAKMKQKAVERQVVL